MAIVRMCKSNVKGVWVEGEVYHLWKYVYGARRSKSWLRPCDGLQLMNESLFFYQSICFVGEVSLQYNTFKVTV